MNTYEHPSMHIQTGPETDRWHQLRALWNEWDPIGVVCMEIEDEYDAYVLPILEMLSTGCTQEALRAYLARVVHDYIGLDEASVNPAQIDAFTQKIMAWQQSQGAEGRQIFGQE